MKKLLALLLIVVSIPLLAQQYNNEWINYNQTYYKFKVGHNGLFRIPKTVLDGVGIGNTMVQNFELWRNGQRVPIYTSVNTGQLPADGYIEFYGERNDGKADRDLYRAPSMQHTDKLSLSTDTSMYFLSVNTSGNGLFYNSLVNNTSSNTLPAEPYFMYKADTAYKNRINPGYAVVIGEYIYSSGYDKGEFWSSEEVRPGTPLTTIKSNLFVYPGGPESSLRFGVFGNALNTRSILVSVNNSTLIDTVNDYFNDVVSTVPVSTALLSSNNASVSFRNNSPIATDRLVVSFFSLTYPRQFNFGNEKLFEFELPAKAQGYYLEIANFAHGGVAPVLLDLVNRTRITGDISNATMVKFVIPPASSNHRFVLISQQAGTVSTINSVTSKQFTNFSQAQIQGNYLIITNPLLYTGTHGNNPVQDFKAYRQSAVGGGFTVQVIEIDELTDQFAFGIKKHPLSVKNFLRFARLNYQRPIENVFLIGRGVTYNEYRQNESNSTVESLNLVPTFGNPASDNMLASDDSKSAIARIPIGRLSVIRGSEIEDYMEKVIRYEDVQKNSGQTIEERAWMKNIMHVTGSSDVFLGTLLCNYMGVYRGIIQDTLFGGKVYTFCKTTTNPAEQINNDRIKSLFEEGLSVINYFGHSSATTLEFNLEDPSAYNNEGKYPVFYVNGCKAGDFYTFNPARLTRNESLSEKFVLAKQRGGIAFVASTHFGIVNYLNLYLNHLYSTMGVKDYGATLGQINKDALQKVVEAFGPSDFYSRMHAEQITLHGDPALRLNSQEKPDYVIEAPQIRINPAFISVAESKVDISVKVMNLGRSTEDSLSVTINRQYPDGTIEAIFKKRIRGINYADSFQIVAPIVATRDKGSNSIIVQVDSDNETDETSETNNQVSKQFFVYEDEARAIYPYQFAIVNDPSQKLFASTADPFAAVKEYVMEMDTSEYFNSSSKVTKKISTAGGSFHFEPGVAYQDSAVYYWRVARAVPAGEDPRWSTSSFVYIANSTTGWNQSHFFQNQKNNYSQLELLDNREYVFDTLTNSFSIKSILFPHGNNTAVIVGIPRTLGCGNYFNSLQFVLIDLKTGNYIPNKVQGSTGIYGSLSPLCPGNNILRPWQYNIFYTTPDSRNRAMNFLDSIPNGTMVTLFNYGSLTTNSNPKFIDEWQSDTAIYGSNKSIYHKLKAIGLTSIDSFYRNIPFVFIFTKNQDGSFTVNRQVMGEKPDDLLDLNENYSTRKSNGSVVSTIIGPSKNWKSVKWSVASQDIDPKDSIVVSLYGINKSNEEVLVYSSRELKKDTAIDFINAQQYPFLRFRMDMRDTKEYTPVKPNYWQVKFDEAPEGVVDPKSYYSFKDSVEIGEPLELGLAFRNISRADFDSVKYKLTITDRNNVSTTVYPQRKRPITSGDSVVVRYSIDTRLFPGKNNLFLDMNTENDQPEQYLFNNFIFRDFYVRPDVQNPLLDVTFDGQHILNKDIVSAKPHIHIKLKDNAKFLLLDDTSLTSVQVKFPDETIRTYSFNSDTLRFTPASTGNDNTATIDFYPHFQQQFHPEGDEYELIVKGKDRSDNRSGQVEYRVGFKVISKPMISNLLNYPNPFTTSTAFVFTLTGSEIPSNLKIQVLTVTGKIVREITKDELGPLRIGRNITEFKWDGTDQFGQRLANGVYLYRVVTTLNGRKMEKYKAAGDDTDRLFNNGYGKMYLMK